MQKHNELSYRLGRRPGRQGPRPQLGDQGWVEKWNTGKQEGKDTSFAMTKETIRIGTWNVRTLREAEKLERLKVELAPYSCDILGMAEMHWTGSGELNGGEVIWSGEENKHIRGVGLLLSKRAKSALLGYYLVNARIIAARFRGKPLNLSVIQVYAPTSDSTDEEGEIFYEQLEKTLRQLPKKDVKLIIGDWNAKVGTDRSGWEQIMGRYGYGQRNERGERLLEFAAANRMIICNTRFQQKECHKWTWMTPDGKHTNMIDMVLIDQRWKTAVRNCRTYQGADIESDHSLVMCNVKLRLKSGKQTNRNALNRNIEVLKNESILATYQNNLQKGLKRPREEETIDQAACRIRNAIKKAEAETLPTKVRVRKPWITERTMELTKAKRQMKQTRSQSEQKMKEYRKKCNEVRKAARCDKEEWLRTQCREIERNAKGHKTREVYRIVKMLNRKWQPRRVAIKDKNGLMLQGKEDIKQRWTEYCRDLYQDKEDSAEDGLQQLAPPATDDENDTIMYEEVEAAIQKLKSQKSPGEDGIPGELIQAGGQVLTKEIHYLCNRIWAEGSIPEEWTRSVLITIPKKGDLSECSNYRTIALLNHICKVLMMVLLRRLQAQMELFMTEEQAGFRKDHCTVHQILIVRLIAEKAKRKGRCIFNCFVDFQKAFDSIKHSRIQTMLESYGVGKRLIYTLMTVLKTAKSAVRVGTELGDWFSVKVGTRQGDPISPTTFIGYLERVLDNVRQSETGFTVQGYLLQYLAFADDIDLVDESRDGLQENVNRLDTAGEKAGLKINREKTKTMVLGQQEIDSNLTVHGGEIENVTEFVYLGSLITWDNDCSKDIKRRQEKATGVFTAFSAIWNSKEISVNTKLNILRTCVFSVLLYACETWTLKVQDKKRLMAFEMKCYRRILHIRWQQKITNEEVGRRIGKTENILQTVMKRKLSLFGHICRMDNTRLLKTMVFGQIAGANRRGRPHREWLDDVTAWCGEDIGKLVRKTENRAEWRQIIQKALDTNGH